MITKKAYAKINISLKVLGKRSDGYHDLKSVMMPLELADILTFAESPQDELVSDFQDANNIILKARDLLKMRYQIKRCVKITLKKNIFVAAGLAGADRGLRTDHRRSDRGERPGADGV